MGIHGQTAEIDDEDWDRTIRLGDLTWSINTGSNSGPYAVATVLLHRAVMGFPDSQVDHRDNDGLNCKKSNLRLATAAQNIWNRSYADRPNRASPYWGVFRDRKTGRWRARIRHDKVNHYLGYFDTPKEAAMAYNAKCLELRGEFAVPNPIPDEGG